MAAQELVDRGKLASDPCALAPGRVDDALGLADLGCGPPRRPPRPRAARSEPARPPPRTGLERRCLRALVLEHVQLALELSLAVALQSVELTLELGDPGLGLGIWLIGGGFGLQPLQLLGA